jgi:hypothetical protein
VSNVGQGDTCVVHTDSPLSLSCRVKKRRLNVEVGLISNELASFWGDLTCVLSLDLVTVDSILVELGAKDQILGFLLD